MFTSLYKVMYFCILSFTLERYGQPWIVNLEIVRII